MPDNSFFTYSVTRQYPSKFTWIILVGGAVLSTLLTFVAVAGNAYQLEPSYTSNYNLTIADKRWYQRDAFAWATDMTTTCQPALLTIGNDYTTTNQGFHYAIESFRRDTTDVPLTASYLNGSLDDCQVPLIVIELRRSNQARLPFNYWTWGSTIARSIVECTMLTTDGPYKVNFTSQLPQATHNYEIEHSFAALEDSAHPGRYIGAQILSAWYLHLSHAMGYSVPWSPGTILDPNNSSKASWGSGDINLMRTGVVDFESMDFFTSTIRIQHNDRELSHMHPPHTLQDWKDQWTLDAENFPPKLPNISIAVDVLSKTYYSLLLSDFNSTSEVMQTNALLSRRGLEYLQNVNDTDLMNAKMAFGGAGDAKGRIESKFDPDSTNLTQPLAFAEYTTLFQQYLCSIPKQKSTFKLLFAVVVADIVLLRTCWTIFGWVATWWIGREDSTVDYCVGCTRMPPGIPLLGRPGPGGRYSQVSGDAGDEHQGHESPGSVTTPTATGA